MMRFNSYIILAFSGICFLSGCAEKKEPKTDIIETASGKWELVWQDEFDYTGLPDSTRWSFDVDGNSWQWGNNEAQWYTSNRQENASVSNGMLTITANLENWEDKKYTSARLRTIGKGDWKYGRIEVSAKPPVGHGTWSAVWMLPSDTLYGRWPRGGEIDIMEYVGRDPETLFSTVHTGKFNHMVNTQVGDTIILSNLNAQFHTYAMEWEENQIRSYIDDSLYFTFDKVDDTIEAWPFNQPFHLIINLAIGGTLGGEVDDSSLPQKLLIDYVRVYKKIEE